MNTTAYPIRIGLSRGVIEWWASMTKVSELLGNYVMIPGVLLTVLFFQRGTVIEGTTLPLATLALPGVLGMLTAYGSMVGIGTIISAEREDGTLLRAKAVPNGMVGYVTGALLRMSLDVVFLIVIMLIPALVFFLIVQRKLVAGGTAGAVKG